MHIQNSIIVVFSSLVLQAMIVSAAAQDAIPTLQKLAAQAVVSAYDTKLASWELPQDIEHLLIPKLLKSHKVILTAPKRLDVDGLFKEYATNITTFTYHPNGRQIITTDGSESIRVFDLKTQASVAQLQSDAPVTALTVDHQGTCLAAGHENGAITLWNAHTWKHVDDLAPVDPRVVLVQSLLFNPTNNVQLASTYIHGDLTIWDIQAKQPRATLVGAQMAYNRLGTELATVRHSSIKVYDATTWQPIVQESEGVQQDIDEDDIYLIAYNNHDKLAKSNRRCCIMIQDDKQPRVVPTGYFSEWTYNAKGNRLLVASDSIGFPTMVWDTSNWNFLALPLPYFSEIAYHPQSKQFAAIAGNNGLHLYAFASYKKLCQKMHMKQACYLLDLLRTQSQEQQTEEQKEIAASLPEDIKNLLGEITFVNNAHAS